MLQRASYQSSSKLRSEPAAASFEHKRVRSGMVPGECACACVEESSPFPKSGVPSVVDNHRGAKWGESLRSPGREKSYFPEQMQTPGLPKPASLCANTAGSCRARAVWVPKVEAISRKSPSCLLSPALKANSFWVKQQVGWEGLLPVPSRSPIPRPDPAFRISPHAVLFSEVGLPHSQTCGHT